MVHNGKAYGFGTFADVFPVWLKFANKPYRMDLADLKDKFFGESVASAQSTIYELDV